MKKFYLFLLTAIMAIGVNFGASAQEDNPKYTVNIEWDTPDAVQIKVGIVTLEIPAGDTSISVTRNKTDFATAMVSAAPGYKLVSCTYEQNGEQKSANKNYQGGFSISINSTNNGLTFHVKTEKIEKDASFTLNVINGANKIDYVELVTSKEQVKGFNDGNNTVKFASNMDTQAYIVPVTGTEIFSVKRNGNAVTKASSWDKYYTVDIANGDNIEVQVYEGEAPVVTECTITLDIDGPADCLTKIFNNKTLKVVTPVDGKFVAEKGEKITLTFGEDYDVTSVKVGDTPLTVNKNYRTARFTVESDATLSIVAKEKVYDMVDYTAYVVNPEGVEIWAGNRLNGVKIDLKDGVAVEEAIALPNSDVDAAYTIPAGAAQKFTFQVSSKYEGVNVYEKEGNWLRTVRQSATSKFADNPITSTTFYVVCEPVKNDSKAVVFIKGNFGRIRLESSRLYGASINRTFDSEGYSEIEFDHDYESPFTIRTGAAIEAMEVFVDGQAQKVDENGVFSGLNLKDGSVLKILAEGKVTEPRKVTFAKEKWAGATVKYDRNLTHADLSQELSCHDGTEVVVTPQANTEVTLDGEKLSPDANGNCTFAVTGNHNVALSYAATETPDTYVFTPDPTAPAESLEEIVITFPYATTVERTDMADDEMTFVATDNSWAPSSVEITKVEGAEKPSYSFKFTPAPVKQTTYKIDIPEGFFTINGEACPDIIETFTLSKSQQGDVEYMTDPADTFPATEWFTVTFLFDESYMVSYTDENAVKSAMTVKFDDTVLTADDYVIGYESNMFMLMVQNEAYFNKPGKFYVKVNAGALSLSGTPSPELEHTWTIIEPKNYTMTVSPDGNTEVTALSEVLITFHEAQTATVFNKNGVRLEEDNYDSGRYYQTGSIVAVEGAEVPTFKVVFDPKPVKSGDYKLTVSYEAFTLDGLQGMPEVTTSYNYTLKVPTGIEGVEADSVAGDGKVYNLQGIRMEADWKDLPAGIYIRDGKKEVKH